jgi:hypothetical protein
MNKSGIKQKLAQGTHLPLPNPSEQHQRNNLRGKLLFKRCLPESERVRR